MKTVTEIIIYCFLAAAVLCDMKWQKVPNQLIVAGYGLSLISQVIYLKQITLLFYLIGAVIPILGLYFIYLLGGIGAGDVKTLSVLGTFMSPQAIFYVIAATFVTGAIVSLIRMLVTKQLFARMMLFYQYAVGCIYSRTFTKYSTVQQKESYLHFTICIFIGYVLVKQGGKFIG